MLKLLTTLFGSRNQRLLRQYGKFVAAANEFEQRMQALPDEGFPAVTASQTVSSAEYCTAVPEPSGHGAKLGLNPLEI